MTVEEILMGMRRGEGCDDGFPGLIPLVRSYLEVIGADTATNHLVDRYVYLSVPRPHHLSTTYSSSLSATGLLPQDAVITLSPSCLFNSVV